MSCCTSYQQLHRVSASAASYQQLSAQQANSSWTSYQLLHQISIETCY